MRMRPMSDRFDPSDPLLQPSSLTSDMDRLTVVKPKRGTIATQVKRPHVAATLGTIDNILWSELKKLEEVVANGKKLDEDELRRLRYLSEIAHDQMKETREQEKHEKLEELSDVELMAKVEEAKRLLGGSE